MSTEWCENVIRQVLLDYRKQQERKDQYSKKHKELIENFFSSGLNTGILDRLLTQNYDDILSILSVNKKTEFTKSVAELNATRAVLNNIDPPYVKHLYDVERLYSLAMLNMKAGDTVWIMQWNKEHEVYFVSVEHIRYMCKNFVITESKQIIPLLPFTQHLSKTKFALPRLSELFPSHAISEEFLTAIVSDPVIFM